MTNEEMAQKIDRVAARLREIKHKIGYIAVHGHHRGYDWNADPMRLTLTEGEANALLDQAIAGAEALEREGAWRAGHYHGQNYLIPVGREHEWQRWCDNREPGEYTSIVPEWAVPVPDDVVITGWRR